MKIERLFLHCSDSRWGDVEIIRQWHLMNGWRDIGYHYTVLNGCRRSTRGYDPANDGLIEAGRSEDIPGAHVRGWNRNSLGICLIGKPGRFTENQLRVVRALFCDLILAEGLEVSDVFGHYEKDPSKTCPGLNMDEFRADLSTLLELRDPLK